MATATAPRDYAALARDRWDTLTIGVDLFDGQPTTSGLLDAWWEPTREILGRMIHGAESPDEYQLLRDAENRLLELLGDAATDLAEAVESRRADEARPVAV